MEIIKRKGVFYTNPKEKATKQTNRILQRLAKRNDADLFRRRAKRILDYVQKKFC